MNVVREAKLAPNYFYFPNICEMFRTCTCYAMQKELR